MQQTSKWQKHLPYLYVGTLRVHYLFSENYKNLNKKQHTDTILDNRGSLSVRRVRFVLWNGHSLAASFWTQVP